MANIPPKAQPELAVDIVVFTIENGLLKALLVRRSKAPAKGSYTLPGGYLWQGETTSQAAKRTLKDKAGVQNAYFEQLYTFDDPTRDSRGHVITVAHLALVPAERLSRSEATKDIRIQAVGEIKDLPFDHGKILAYALKRLRTKLGYSNVAYSLLPELFTLSQLQEVYEVILGHEIDKRNFRKKIQSLDLIEPTEQKLTGRKHRPARLFRFKTHSYSELEEPIF